jgi:hypothetical protein
METNSAIKYDVNIILIPIFADNRFKQTDPNYYKVLLNDSDEIISKRLSVSHKDIIDCLNEVMGEYLKVDYNWPFKNLSHCRKHGNQIDIIFTTTIPYIKDCNKKGSIININKFLELNTEQYYAEVVTRISPNVFG